MKQVKDFDHGGGYKIRKGKYGFKVMVKVTNGAAGTQAEGRDTDGRQMTGQPAGSHPDAGLHQHLEECHWTTSRSGGLSEEEYHWLASRSDSIKIWRSLEEEKCYWTPSKSGRVAMDSIKI